MARDRFLRQTLGSTYPEIRKSRILVVGAGGIGCELLKNLVTTGFGEIHIVDLDTIDLSNLNRQFLFRHSHIKKSKALIAKETAGKFNPNVNIEAYHADIIKDSRFNIEWFKSFRIVFNALDNLAARRHVNKMCIIADVPLIESGTTGFNGQVQPIKPGFTQCYDCTPKETPKSFPVCTIRSTPSQPIHCIVWAKSYLFNELFGVSEEENTDVDNSEDADNREEIEKLRQEASGLKKIRSAIGSHDFARQVFEKVYTDDIKRLRGMEDMWKTRKPPIVLDFDELLPKATAVPPTVLAEDQKRWTLVENLAVFNSTLTKLSIRMEGAKTAMPDDSAGTLEFDKDDRETLDFVAAAANLRSIVFGIETKSEFEIKQMAGNIIPAIATTNATTAALCALQAYKVMTADFLKAKMVFLSKSVDRAIDKEDLRTPDPACAVCGNIRAALTIDPARATLQDLVNDILISKLAYTGEMSISNAEGVIFDPDLEENLPKKLTELSIGKDTFITIIDEEDAPKVNLVLAVSEAETSATDPAVSLRPAVIIIPKKVMPLNGTAQQDNGTASSQKRKRGPDNDDIEIGGHKRGKVVKHINGSHIQLDETDDGAIILD